jgi:RimJ/RimL family protein N-acetyltransferase
LKSYYYKCIGQQIIKFENFSLEAVQPKYIQNIRVWRNTQIEVLRQKETLSRIEQTQYFKNHVWPELDKDEPRQILFSFFLNDILIGYGGLVHISWSNLSAEISYLCDTSLVNQETIYRKYLLSFLKILTNLSFKNLQLKRLFTETYSFRKNQIKILEEHGLNYESIRYRSCNINGRYYDSIIHSILND